MKLFTNKSFLQKIVIILVIILLFEYAIPTNVSNAMDWGGVLFKPIQMLTLAIGDVGMTGLNLFIFNQRSAVLTLYKEQMPILNFIFDAGVFIFTGAIGLAALKLGQAYKASFDSKDFRNEIDLPIILVTPDQIFSNNVPMLDANIIKPNKYVNNDGEKMGTPVSILQSTISSWYMILRNICIVAFLSILVYIGIRILISSVSESKAKYKQMLFDWIIGLFLLFFMHYIMSFAIMMTEKLTDIVSINNIPIIIESDDVDLTEFKIKDDARKIIDIYNKDENGQVSDNLRWKTDMMGFIRFYAQTNIDSHPISVQFAYTLMYIVLVIYTYMFVFQYGKRLLSIIFLTLMAPFIAFSYPLEKVKGSAQIFNNWLKEYIFNLLLQPMHLILYTVFVGSAITLAVKYPIYAVIVLGFLLEAEKIIRKMFGFDSKESLTGAAASGIFTGAMVMKGVDAVLNRGKKSSGNSKGSDKKADEDDSRVRMAGSRTASNPDNEDDFMRNALGSGGSNDSVDNDNDDVVVDNDDDNVIDNNNNNSINITDGSFSNFNTDDFSRPESDSAGLNSSDDDSNINVDSHNSEDNGTQNDTNLDIGDDSQSVVPRNNYLHMKDPNNYDEYGNPIVRDGKQVKKQRKKVKSRPAKNLRQKLSSAAKSKPARFAKGAIKFYAPKVGKGILKAGAVGVVAGTAGMVGLAAGLATDKPTNAITYTMGAVTGGAAVGSALTNKVVQGPSNITNKVREARSNMAREAYKDDPKAYKEYLNAQADKEFLRNKQIKSQYSQAFGSGRAEEMMKNAIKYREHGITDNELIIKTMKETSGEIGKTSAIDNRRIAAAKLASGVSNSKDIESMTKRLEKQGYKKDIINQNEEFIRNIRGLEYN